MLLRQLSFADINDDPAIALAGKRIAITGYLPLKRSVVVDAILRGQGIYASSVTRNTDILVLGEIKYNSKMDKAGSRKLLAARKIINDGGKIQLLYADEFLAALDAAAI